MLYRVRSPCVYILASARNGTLYIGVTSDLFQRIALHKQDLIEGLTKKYRVHRLVYYETHPTIDAAIRREKQLDLFDEATGEILEAPADLSRRTS